MRDAFAPVLKQSLSDKLAQRIRGMIQKGDYSRAIACRRSWRWRERFGVGHPTIREALKKLETMGIVEIRHGSGVYVSRSEEVLVLASPDYSGTVTKKLLLDLIRTRMPLEMQSVAEAVQERARSRISSKCGGCSRTAGQNFDNDDRAERGEHGLPPADRASRPATRCSRSCSTCCTTSSPKSSASSSASSARAIATTSEHLAILEALEQRDEALGVERMRKHLQGVDDSIHRWDPDNHPVS